jgi:hypothetical protein
MADAPRQFPLRGDWIRPQGPPPESAPRFRVHLVDKPNNRVYVHGFRPRTGPNSTTSEGFFTMPPTSMLPYP